MTQDAQMPMPALRRTVEQPYEQVLEQLPKLLQQEGFGVLTEIDVKETLHKKLGVEFPKYKILGACNPSLAHKALTEDMAVGVLLPCNVVVHETAPGSTEVMAMDPEGAMGIFGGAALKELAADVRARLARVLDTLAPEAR